MVNQSQFFYHFINIFTGRVQIFTFRKDLIRVKRGSMFTLIRDYKHQVFLALPEKSKRVTQACMHYIEYPRNLL